MRKGRERKREAEIFREGARWKKRDGERDYRLIYIAEKEGLREREI